jgi:AcrR family transcriptional regulator
MPPDATQTKRRILTAARAEFARYGLAGARVERIAENARANKRSLYVHFGAKEELFDLVVAQSLMELADAVPFDATALPVYAGALFDILQERPDVLRLTTWAALERPQPIEAEVDSYRSKIAAVREAQAAGALPTTHDAVSLLAMILALVTSWTGSSWSLRALGDGTDPARPPAEFRDRLTAAVEALVGGAPAGG